MYTKETESTWPFVYFLARWNCEMSPCITTAHAQQPADRACNVNSVTRTGANVHVKDSVCLLCVCVNAFFVCFDYWKIVLVSLPAKIGCSPVSVTWLSHQLQRAHSSKHSATATRLHYIKDFIDTDRDKVRSRRQTETRRQWETETNRDNVGQGDKEKQCHREREDKHKGKNAMHLLQFLCRRPKDDSQQGKCL